MTTRSLFVRIALIVSLAWAPDALIAQGAAQAPPVSQETLLDLWARWGAWLDKYVKNPHKADNNTPAPAGGGGGRR